MAVSFSGLPIFNDVAPPELYYNGLPYDGLVYVAIDTVSDIAYYHQGIPFTENDRIAGTIGTAAPAYYGSGGAPFDATGRLALSTAAARNTQCGVIYSTDGRLRTVTAPDTFEEP